MGIKQMMEYEMQTPDITVWDNGVMEKCKNQQLSNSGVKNKDYLMESIKAKLCSC